MKYGIFLLWILVLLTSCKSKEVVAEELPEVEIQQLKKDKIEKNMIDSAKLDLIRKLETNVYDVKYTVLRQGSNRGFDSGIIRSKEELKRLNFSDASIFSGVDFSKQAVVIARAGEFATGGYSISLASAILNDNALTLNFVVSHPAPDVAVTMAFTYPYIVVVVDVEKDTAININIIGGNTRSGLGSELLTK